MQKLKLLLFCLLLTPTMVAQNPDAKLVEDAKNGNPEAQNNLGLFYINNGNQKEALHWWELSAKQDYVMAKANLGESYFRNKDYATALKWLIPAANGGSSNAAYRLAICYRNGFGIDKNIHEALKWSTTAAKAGQKSAYLFTGSIYEREFDDAENAAIWYKRAADNGDAQALNWLGAESMKSGDTDTGFSYFMQAAKKGLPQAQFNVGVAYYNNEDYDAAKVWLDKAAKQGYAKAIEMLKSEKFQ